MFFISDLQFFVTLVEVYIVLNGAVVGNGVPQYELEEQWLV